MTRPTAGGPVDALPTPALLIDAEQLERNVAAMAAWADGTVALRPHFKAHKCLEIARLQTAAGAIGITAATVWEARALARAGIGEILLANQVVTADKLRVMAEAAAAVPVVVALDDGDAAAAFSRALAAAGAHARALVDVDVGMGRGGVRTVDDALALAGRIAELPRLELAGVMGYEGHVVLEPDRERRAALAGEAMALLGRHAEALRDAGHAIGIVSAGGTNTHDATGPHPAVTELQAGTYALMDTAYQPFASRFEPALGILGTVVSRHGDRAVLDCGTKVIGTMDIAAMRVRAPGLALRELHEEHALLDVLEGPGPVRGDRVEVVAPYSGATANLNDAYHVVRGGEVRDVWPIVARGPGR